MAEFNWNDHPVVAHAQELSKEGFSWDQHPETEQDPSTGATALHMGIKGATLGTAGPVADLTTAGLHSGLDYDTFLNEYRKAMNSREELEKKMEKAHPVISKAADVGGSIGAWTLLPEAKIAQAAAGGVQGLATSNAPDVVGKATDAAVGSGLGYLGGALGEKLREGLRAKKLASGASDLAASAVGIKPGSNAAQVRASGQALPDIGRTLLDSGSLPMTGGKEATAGAVGSALEDSKSGVTDLIKRAQEAVAKASPESLPSIGDNPEDVQALLDQMKTTIDKPALAEQLSKQYEAFIPNLEANNHNLPALNELKQGLQDSAEASYRTAGADPDALTKSNFYNKLASMVRQHIEDTANAASPGLGDSIAEGNANSSNLIKAQDALESSLGKQDTFGGARAQGLAKIGAGAGATAFGHPLLGATSVAGGATELASGNTLGTLGKIAGAKTLDVLSKGSKVVPQAAPVIGKAAQGTIANPGMTEEAESAANRGLDLVKDIGGFKTDKQKAIPWYGKPFSQYKTENLPDLEDNHSDKMSSSDFSKRIAALDNDELQNVVAKLKGNPGLSAIGHGLGTAIDQNNSYKKNAALFSLSQNPQARELLRGSSPEEEDKEDVASTNGSGIA